MSDKNYSFKDISGTLSGVFVMSAREDPGEPLTLDFVYFDKDGVAWRVRAHGHRTRTGEVRKDPTPSAQS